LVSVKFIGVLRNLAAKESIQFAVDKGTSLKNVLHRVSSELPKLREMLKCPESSLVILINEREIACLDGLNTKVNDKDKVVIVSVSHGG